jgi:hypothetical protein
MLARRQRTYLCRTCSQCMRYSAFDYAPIARRFDELTHQEVRFSRRSAVRPWRTERVASTVEGHGIGGIFRRANAPTSRSGARGAAPAAALRTNPYQTLPTVPHEHGPRSDAALKIDRSPVTRARRGPAPALAGVVLQAPERSVASASSAPMGEAGLFAARLQAARILGSNRVTAHSGASTRDLERTPRSRRRVVVQLHIRIIVHDDATAATLRRRSGAGPRGRRRSCRMGCPQMRAPGRPGAEVSRPARPADKTFVPPSATCARTKIRSSPRASAAPSSTMRPS